ncbi:hypothetical protein NPA08_01555 [Mycoplasmopsis citelli]|uniref:hypothetical protein n=1 Tax=Mycoplasmopsis citelli TaxID=171281 RepID=UPI002114DA4F|nr:hypothetical protein [Mycoplasmopsis citelli]UUD36502.1 hypothetical protein NPA08_01555 [Mycoplasmopsis citelli]
MKTIIRKYLKLFIAIISVSAITGVGVYFLNKNKTAINNSKTTEPEISKQKEQDIEDIISSPNNQKAKIKYSGDLINEFNNFKSLAFKEDNNFQKLISHYQKYQEDLLLDQFYNKSDIWTQIYQDRSLSELLISTFLDNETSLNDLNSNDNKSISKIRIGALIELIKSFTGSFEKQNEIFLSQFNENYFNLINSQLKTFWNEYNQQINFANSDDWLKQENLEILSKSFINLIFNLIQIKELILQINKKFLDIAKIEQERIYLMKNFIKDTSSYIYESLNFITQDQGEQIIQKINSFKKFKEEIQNLKRNQLQLLSDKETIFAQSAIIDFLNKNLKLKEIFETLNFSEDQRQAIELLIHQLIENKRAFVAREEKNFGFIEQKINDKINDLSLKDELLAQT